VNTVQTNALDVIVFTALVFVAGLVVGWIVRKWWGGGEE